MAVSRVTRTLAQTGRHALEIISATWTAAASGLVTDIALGRVSGVIERIVTIPGTPAPTSGYDVAILDADRQTMIGGGGGRLYWDVVMQDAPVGYWRMDAASGTTELDRSGNTRNATIAGGVTLGQAGALADGDTAELLDGATGSLSVADNDAWSVGSAFTVEAWFNPVAVTGQRNILTKRSKDSATEFEWEFRISSGVYQWQIEQADSTAYARAQGGTPANGAWVHLVGTWDGTTIRLYVNGAQVASSTTTTGTKGPNAAGLLYIGGETPSAHLFSGSLDEVALYNYALSATQVAAHYAARLAGGGAGADRSATSAQEVACAVSTYRLPSVSDQPLTLAIGGNVVASAQGTVRLYVRK